MGPPSNDVVITYSTTVTPGMTFDIFEIYQTAWFVLESIEMVVDQDGPGTEEFQCCWLRSRDLWNEQHALGRAEEVRSLLRPNRPQWTAYEGACGHGVAVLPQPPRHSRVAAHLHGHYFRPRGRRRWHGQRLAVNLWTVAQAAASGEIAQDLGTSSRRSSRTTWATTSESSSRRAARLPRPS